MKLSCFYSLLLSLPFLPKVLAWGALGHMTVAYIATNFVDPDTETYFQTILNNKTTSYLAGVATWADSYRYTSAGRFSEPYHFIDAEDNPPTSCGVTYSRDCGTTGCVVSAIQNYVGGFPLSEVLGKLMCTQTSRILNTDLSAPERYIAAKVSAAPLEVYCN